jgi:hypothetical protein
MTQQRWWLAAGLLTLALTCAAHAQSPEGYQPPQSPVYRAQVVACPPAKAAEPKTPVAVYEPEPCDGPPAAPACAGSCAKSCTCPASARHNEGGSACGSGCASNCSAKGCCAGCSCGAKQKKAHHHEGCCPAAAVILPTWFGPMPVPMPPPMASLFFGHGPEYHFAVNAEPLPPPQVVVPPAATCPMPAVEQGCPYAYPPPPPAPPVAGMFPPPPVPHMLRYTIARPAAAVKPWQMHVSADSDKAEMEMNDGATKICSESMEVTLGDKHELKVRTYHKQISLEGDNLKALADKVSKGCDGDCLVLDGHVSIEYEQDDQKVEAKVEHVKISLKDGHMEIKMGGHASIPASCH